MGKITKRAVDALRPESDRDVFAWDTELRGFGVRAKPSGVKTFLIQHRNAEGRTRRFVLGQCGVLTPEIARHLARKKLTSVAEGGDPSADRQGIRTGMSVKEVCDWYIEQAEAGRLLGRNRRPIKASSLKSDRSRIEIHIKPLLGGRCSATPSRHHQQKPCARRPPACRWEPQTQIERRRNPPTRTRDARSGGRRRAPIGVVRVLDRICRRAKLEGVTPHALRHTFASVAGDLGFSELAIAGLLGHSAHGVTQKYVHLDTALVVAADPVSMEVANMLGREGPAEKSAEALRVFRCQENRRSILDRDHRVDRRVQHEERPLQCRNPLPLVMFGEIIYEASANAERPTADILHFFDRQLDPRVQPLRRGFRPH